ncbi:MAG: hypothetical protein ACM32E_32460 [Gemmatimonadota bacterium]
MAQPAAPPRAAGLPGPAAAQRDARRARQEAWPGGQPRGGSFPLMDAPARPQTGT